MTKLDAKAVAKELGVSLPMVRVLVRRGAIGFYRVGRRLVFDPADVDAYLRRCRVPARDEAGGSPHVAQRANLAGDG
jgi:excisionase family DNA binding protein